MDVEFYEIRTAIANFQAKFPSSLLSPENTSKQSNVDLNSKLDMKITVSGVHECVNSVLSMKPKSREVVLHGTEYVNEKFKVSMKTIQVLPMSVVGRNSILNSKCQSLLVTFNDPWVVRKVLSRTYRLKKHNETKERNIFVKRLLSKEDQQKKDCHGR